MRAIFGVLLCLVLIPAWAINKCTDAAGKTTYTDAPCAGHQKTDAVVVSRPALSNSNATADHERLTGWLDNQARDEKRDTLNRTIHDKQREIEDLRAKMDRELRDLQISRGRAMNNLAGATYEESLATQAQAVTSRYNSQIDQDQREIEAARSDLKTLDEPPAVQSKPKDAVATRPGV